jgi:hypothetical protein
MSTLEKKIFQMNRSEQKKKGYDYKREDLYTVIILVHPLIPEFKQALKYHNVSVDKPAALESFKKFILGRFPGATYMNVYGGMSGDYYRRIYF